MEELHIQMLGGFSLRIGDRVLADTDNRSRKTWVLLAYLIYQREHPVSQKKLIDLLWGDEPDSVNPENALRITMHRTRALLEQLVPGAGRTMILRRSGSYQWNGGGQVDYDRFGALCLKKPESPELRLQYLLEALELYQGDFLPRQSSEIWVIPISARLHNDFLSVAQEAVDLLAERGRTAEAAQICRRVLALEPYHEPSCQVLMQLLAAMGDRKGAAEVYESLSRRLFQDFGVSPSEETRAVYRAAAYSPDERVLSMDEVMGNLQESSAQPGALQCDFDYFRILCFSVSRAMARSGSVAHVVLLNVALPPDKASTRQALDRIMGQLGQQIRLNLRRGDVFCQCSISQYAILLSRANYENSEMICQRLVRSFRRAYVYTTAELSYAIRPLPPEPDDPQAPPPRKLCKPSEP